LTVGELIVELLKQALAAEVLISPAGGQVAAPVRVTNLAEEHEAGRYPTWSHEGPLVIVEAE
jgi:hypothetical protein